jgi:hypothetical protein
VHAIVRCWTSSFGGDPTEGNASVAESDARSGWLATTYREHALRSHAQPALSAPRAKEDA